MDLLSSPSPSQKFVDNTQQCLAFAPHANFPAHNLNFHWRWSWWDQIQAIFSNLFYFIKIVLTYCENKLFYWSRKTFAIPGWRPRICKIFETTWTINSNNERSEQFWDIKLWSYLKLDFELEHLWYCDFPYWLVARDP